ncbi:aminofutalosine synthase MqnE [Phycisphaerales bacterium AB-hyl4]|uniref:Aminodeoxyfutalosine synthase n=1 Tax=Natronomicrosphaera hydrolytica TaxID=3242702 RepID=A0ABV4UAH4_9BACT
MDTALAPIADKVYAGQRLSADDGLTLLRTRDIHTLGQLANHVRRERHGNKAYYNINRHLNYSNICALSCKFCAFHRKRGDEGAYEYSVDDAVAEATKAVAAGATELHMVGGLHPFLPFSYYTDLLSAIHSAAPNLHIKAFTAVEIVHLARISKRPNDLTAVLSDLKDAGLGSLPGGGAEVFDDRVHDEAFKGKIRSDKWLDVHRHAHKLGLMSNATILYGHIESLEDRIHHLELLREAQDEAINEGHQGRFQTVIPLPFIPDDSELEHLYGPTALDDLRMLATARLMLDNFSHIKAFWIMQTLPFSQTALDWGVDDMDGTVVWYDITKVGGADNHQEVDVSTLRRAILDAGYEPVERDTLYRTVERTGAQWRLADQPVTV